MAMFLISRKKPVHLQNQLKNVCHCWPYLLQSRSSIWEKWQRRKWDSFVVYGWQLAYDFQFLRAEPSDCQIPTPPFSENVWSACYCQNSLLCSFVFLSFLVAFEGIGNIFFLCEDWSDLIIMICTHSFTMNLSGKKVQVRKSQGCNYFHGIDNWVICRERKIRKTLLKAKRTQGIEYFDSFNTFCS